MKKLIFILFIVLSATTVNAQLANTKWKGTLQGDNPLDVVIDFKTDTLLVVNAQDSSVIETMTYTTTDTSFTLKKVSGASDCSSGSTGKYRFDITKDEMFIKLILDDCDGRSFYLKDSKWTKIG